MKIKRVCSIAGGFLVLSLVGCGTEPGGNTRGTSGAAPRTGETAAKRERFEGFSFELPSGWTRVAPDRDNTKALLVLGKDREKAKAMIKIDVGPPGSPNPKDIAETLAHDCGGKVQPEPVNLDGVRAVQVLVSSPTPGRPSEAIVVIRGGKVYVMTAGAVAGTDFSDGFEHVRKSWKWDK